MPAQRVRRLLGAAALAVFAAAACWPRPTRAAPVCEAAARDAERASGIPAGLLAAIGKVESGRHDRLTGATQIWPWTVNIRGQGVFFETQADAVNFAAAALAAGFRSLDVGCFQVNLLWHPGAFASLAEAFDPVANARYAAAYLGGLANGADWATAIGRYHSANESRALPYRASVLANWTGSGAPASPQDPVIIRMTAAARTIRVWYGVTP